MNQYNIGDKIRYKHYSFSGQFTGYTEGYITEINDFSFSSFHCRFLISKAVRIIRGELRIMPERENRTSDFYTKSILPPEVITENW